MTAFEDNDDLYREHLPNLCTVISDKAKKCCTPSDMKKRAKKHLPILEWLPKYQLKYLTFDFVAGLTVGLTAIPQAIAYGTIAGLPPQYGLYSAFMGCFVYMLLGTCKDVTVGPTAIMSLMVQTHVSGSPDFAVLACFLSGCIITLLGILNLGVLVQFISVPVVCGFTTAAAITIASGQVNSLFGIKSPSNEFLESWENFFSHISETRRNDALLGVGTLIVLLLMRKIKDIPCKYKTLTKYISLSRNALAVIVGIILCYCLHHDDYMPFKVNGEITPGLPPARVPPFSTNVNGTTVSFGEMVSNLGASIATIPLISILESVAISKAFSKGKIVNASQEMLALGIANIASSFFLSMPITGSFTRSAINNASGVKTTLGGAFTGTLVIMALAFLTQTFYFIPKATLAAIIIGAMLFMVEYERIAEIWKSKKVDMLPFLVTVLACLFWSLEYGMLCGIAFNLLFILQRSARPKIIIKLEKLNGIVVGVVEVQENLSYSSAEFLKATVIKFITKQDMHVHMIVIAGEDMNTIDSTVALNIVSLREDLRMLDCDLICWNWCMATAGVVCRVHHDVRTMFKFGKTLQELVNDEVHSKAQSDANSTSTTIPL